MLGGLILNLGLRVEIFGVLMGGISLFVLGVLNILGVYIYAVGWININLLLFAI